ncbi:MAG: choice-of-anchor J domain-containing protein, partial [Bacteroidales bacterium]|nr:choice-of-anchor J domain-containing protein [Bacteroidales bacterium]
MKKLIFSVLLLLMTVIGAVAQQSLPYSYGFEDNDLSADGWTLNSCHSSTGISSDATKTGSYGFRFYYRSNPPQYLISPELTGTVNGVQVEFFYKNYSSSYAETFQVGYSTTDNSIGSFTWGAEITASDQQWTLFSENYPSNTKYVSVKLNSDDQFYLYLDDFSFTIPASCIKPSSLITSNITHNSIDLSWTQNSSTTDWVLEYSTNSDFSGAISKNVNGTPSYSISNLNSTTTYYVRVKADCGGGDESEWSDAISFSTTAVAEEVGDSWSDNFEGATCEWEFVNGTLTNAWAWGTATNNGGAHALYISKDGGTTNEYNINSSTMVYATKLLNFATGKYEFSYDWRANGESNYDYLRVALVPASATLSAGSSVPLGFGTTELPTGWIALDGGSKLNLISEWQNKELAINVTAGNYYLVFAWRNDSGDGTQPPAAIDNVSITRFACAYDVTGLAVSNITTTGATLAWTAGEASQWQVVYSTSSDFAGAIEQIVNVATYNMTSLTSATAYYVKVRAYCGGSDFGAWSSVLEFPTACEAITSYPWNENFDSYTAASIYTPTSRTLPICWNYINTCTNSSYMYYPTMSSYSSASYAHSTSNYLRLYSYYYSYTDYDPQPQYAILPAMENLNTKRIEFWAKGYNASSTFKVGLMTDPSDASTFVQVGEEHALTTSYQKFTIDLTGSGNYIAIMIDAANSSRNYNGMYIDDIIVMEQPSCLEPTALSKSNVAARTAVLSWTANGSETAWQICLNDNEGNLIDVNTNPYTLTGLTPETAYNVKVRAKCSESDFSEWTSNISFTTTAACPVPTALAYADVTTNSVVLSWTAGASETAWQICVNNEEDDLIDVTENPYTLTGLDPATSYSVKVRANCGDTDGNSQWTSAVLFSTSCLAITELPYTESFESETCPASCWNIEYAVANPASSNVMKHVTSTDNSPYGCGVAANDGDRSFLFSSYSNTSDYNQYLISPEFDVDGSYLVSFYYRQRSTDEHLYFGTSSTGNDVSDFTWTDEEIPAYSGTWKLYRTIVPAGTKYFAINYNPGACLYYAWIDNVVVREVSTAAEILTYSLPTEAAPASITSGANTGTIDITVTNSTNFDADLNPTYTISDYAEISAPVITGDGDSRTIRYTVTAEAGNHKDWTVNVTKVPVSRDAFITGFTFAGQKAGTTAEIVSNTESNIYTVHAVAEWNVDLTSIAPEITISPAAEITPESGYARDFSSPVPYTVTAEDGTTFHIYSVTIINAPDACVNPLVVNANDVTATTATLSWVQAYTETSYIVKVSTEEMTNMAATADVFDGTVYATTTAFENLTENTQYFVYVQSNCDNAEGWTEYSFRTECGVFAVPFVETFENNSETVSCWTAISNNTENDVASGKMGIFDVSGNNVFRFSSYSRASNEDYNQYLITPELALTEDAVLTFDYAKYSSNETFRVMTSTTDANIASFTALGDDVTANSTNFTEYRIVVPAATKYIAINYFSNYQYYLYVDNFKLTNVYTITASADPNGSIDQNGNVEVEYGESQSFTITPDECYHIASVTVDGVEAISNVDENGVYTFSNVTSAHTIAATFALNTYNITSSVVGNGTITESCVANCGESKSFAINPQSNCYRIASVLVDGVEAINDLDENGTYLFQNVTADHTIVATFEQITYTITATAGENGTITETSEVNCGVNKEISITPATCYQIASVLVDDVDVTATVVAANGVYTFENVIANHTIAATFEQITYTITATADANGSIVANDGNGNVANCGEYKAFTITANNCYHIASVLVDGVEAINDLDENGTYTFQNVTANHTIAATFAINTYAITTTVEGNGTISGESTASCGESKSYTIAPANTCYRIASFTVDGVDAFDDLDENGVYAMQNITADHVLV